MMPHIKWGRGNLGMGRGHKNLRDGCHNGGEHDVGG